jgi:glycosyltransferase involved in cell wall biosynthesis
VYQPVLREILFGNYDAVILGHELKFISNLVLLLAFKLARKPVIWWGHGFHRRMEKNQSVFLFSIVSRIKVWLARSADKYISYTATGGDLLRQLGMPENKITVIRNTIDMEQQCALHQNFLAISPAEIRKRSGLRPDSLILLYIGRVYKQKRIEELLSLVDEINRKRLSEFLVEAVIVGGGPGLTALEGLGREISGVHFLGEIYDQEVIAQFMRVSCAMLIPGAVGLAVNHAFAHGLPVITRQHALHGPELEYVESGRNGLVVPGDFDNFVRCTVDYLNSESLRKNMAEAALRTRDRLTLSYMVETFDSAVRQSIACRLGRTSKNSRSQEVVSQKSDKEEA